MLLGLRTVIYKAPDLAKAKEWYGRVFGIAPYFDAIVSSAEVGCEKPDPRIFREALTRLRTSPGQTLHVGDSIDDDIGGAKAAGLDALLVDRRGVHAGFSGRRVADLHELRRILL